MDANDELTNLQQLHQKGELSDLQYRQAKAKLLVMLGKHDEDVAPEIADLRRQDQLAKLNQAWDTEYESHLMEDEEGQYLPTKGRADALRTAGIVMLIALPFVILATRDVLTILGLVSTIVGVFAFSARLEHNAVNYQQALRSYEDEFARINTKVRKP